MSNLSDAEDSDDGDVSSSTRELHERMELGVTRVLQGLQRQLQAPTLDPAYPAALNQTVALLSAMAQVLDAHRTRKNSKIHSNMKHIDWDDIDQLGLHLGDIRWKAGWPASLIASSSACKYPNLQSELLDWRKSDRRTAHQIPGIYESMQFARFLGPIFRSVQEATRRSGFELKGTHPDDLMRATLVRPDGNSVNITGKAGTDSCVLVYFPSKPAGEPGHFYFEHPHFSVRPGIARMCFVQPDRGDAFMQVPRAILKTISFCQRHDLRTMRGCVASTDDWIFFIYTFDPQGTHHAWVAPAITLGSKGDASKNADIVIAVLEDWVRNPNTKTSEFFDLFSDEEVDVPLADSERASHRTGEGGPTHE